MRTLTVSVLAGLSSLGVTAVQAADLDYGVLRGPEYETVEPVIDWSGVYVGAFAGYTSASINQKNAFQPLLANYFRNRDIETEFGVSSYLSTAAVRVGGASYGAFAGFNYQFDDTVIGVEADYTRFDRAGRASDTIGRIMTTKDGIEEVVALSGVARTEIEDYGTIRARAGYAMGSLLPFLTGGVAIGRAVIKDEVQVQNYGYDQTTYKANQSLTSGLPQYVYNHGYRTFNQNYPGNSSTPTGGIQTVPASATLLSTSPKTKTVGGIALGAGLEFALTSNILLRAEYQYVLFNDFDGHKVNLNTVRAGAAVKF